MHLLFVLTLMINFSCNCIDKDQNLTIEHNKSISKQKNKRGSIIDNSIGVITTSFDYEFGDLISIYDKNKNKKTEIKIISEYQILSLKCLSMSKDFYEVVLDNNEIGFISIKSKEIIFQTWEEHILNVFSIGFDNNLNPLLQSPSREAKVIKFDEENFYLPIEIKDEWLKLKWQDEKNQWHYGWIRWKEKDKLIIELFYFA